MVCSAEDTAPHLARPDGLIRIVIAVRAGFDRDAVTSFLKSQADFTTVASAKSWSEAVSLCKSLQPTVLILDTAFVPPGGAPGVSEILGVSPHTSVVAIAAHHEARCRILNPPEDSREAGLKGLCQRRTNCLEDALRQGALGVIRRSASSQDIVQAVRTVARGEQWLGAPLDFSPDQPPPLSKRELTIALLVGRGYRNRDIGESLGVCESTVKKHISHVLRRLDLQDRLQLGLFVARNPELFQNVVLPGDGHED